jgi:hypothetical protein
MIELEKEFVSGAGGFSADPLTYTQLKRNEKAAVYMRSRDGKPYDYETFLIKVKPKGTRIFNKILEDDEECYPSCSQFGRIAWSYGNVGMAMFRFHELTHGKIKEEIVEGEDDAQEEPTVEAKKSSMPVTVDISSDGDDNEVKPYKGPDLIIPVGEFSTKQLAAHNNVQYPIAFLFRKDAERKGKIKFSRKQKAEGRGKPTDIFVSI